MFNKTFKTLDKYPKIYIGFLIYGLVIALFSYVGSYIGDMLHSKIIYAGSLDGGLMEPYLALPVLVIGYILICIFLFPYLFTYIKKACVNTAAEEGLTFFYQDEIDDAFTLKNQNYVNILKASWYKIVVIYAVTVPVIILLTIGLFSVAHIRLGSLILIIFLIVAGLSFYFMQIVSVCVIMEDSFKEGIKGAFKIGKRLVLHLVGATIFINIPALLIDTLNNYIAVEEMSVYSFLENRFAFFSSGQNVFFILLLLASTLYGVFSSAFIYTYITHKYIYQKCEKAREDDFSIKFEGDIKNNSFLTGDGQEES